MASNEEIPLELLQALEAPGAPAQGGGAPEIPAELLAALGGAGKKTPAPTHGGWMDYLRAAAPTLNRIGQAGTLAVGAPEATDVSRISKMLFNATGASNALYGKDLPVSDHSKTLAALKGLWTGKEPVSGYGDTLREIDVPSVDVGAVSPLVQLLKATGAMKKDTRVESNDVLGLIGDVSVNPGGLPGLLSRGTGKVLSKGGNKVFDNAWRFITREFGGAAGASKNPAISKENFLQMIKEEGVGKGAYTPQDIVRQYEAKVAKEAQPLNEMFAGNEGTQVPLAPGHNATTLGNIEKDLATGDRATREAAIDKLKSGVAEEYHPMLDEMKNRLITAKGEVEQPLTNFIATAADGKLSLDQLRKYKGNQWKIAKKQGGTAAGEVASDIAGGTNDLLANTLEKASVGGEEAFRTANQRVATMLKPENALMREVTKAEGVAPNTAMDAGLEGWALVKALAGEPKAALEIALSLGAKKGGKALNSLTTGSRVGQRLMGWGQKGENLAQLLEGARGNLWSKLGGP